MIEKSLSVIIPAYNEADYIEETLTKVKEFLANNFISSEIIVVDDGSSDNTAEKVSALASENKAIRLIKNEKNKGKGASVREGMLAAKLDYVLFSDADLSTPIDEVLKFFDYFEYGCDVVIGSRALHESQLIKKQGFLRRNMGRVFNMLVQLLLFEGINDTQCGFKCFKQEAAKKVFGLQKIMGFSFDVEVLCIAERLGYSIKEIPIRWINREASRVSVVRDSFMMFFDLVRIKINKSKGRYEIK